MVIDTAITRAIFIALAICAVSKRVIPNPITFLMNPNCNWLDVREYNVKVGWSMLLETEASAFLLHEIMFKCKSFYQKGK